MRAIPVNTWMHTLRRVCRGEDPGSAGTAAVQTRWWWWSLVVTLVGAGLYGAVIGWWRAPLQALYAGIKLPLLLLLTAVGNALINGMLAQLLGARLRFRDSFRLVLTAMAIFAMILGSLAPVTLFILMNTPPVEVETAALAHSFNKLMHTGIIAFAGTIAHVRLRGMLVVMTGSRSVSNRILAAWLAVNLFLGAQLSWILRPYMSAPHLPVEFLRPNALEGNFYETLLSALTKLVGG